MRLFSQRAWDRAERLTNRLASKFAKDENGATAVEFAIVALPFFALLFGIMELALVFFVSSTLTHATSEAGRKIRTGNFQACGGADEFKALVCGEMKNLFHCWKNVRIDVVEGSSYKTIAMPAEPAPLPRDGTQTGADAIPQTPNGQFDANAAGSQMVVRSLFYYRLNLPPMMTRLENRPGTGVRVISATTAFRNEPFPASGSCDSDTQAAITAGTP